MKRLIALSWGGFCILFGFTLLAWVGYNLLIERLPQTEGKNPLRAIAFGIAAIGVGVIRVRKQQQPTEPEYHDSATEQRWCAEMRRRVVVYLKGEHVSHGQIGEWPAWHVAPCVSVWAIESKAKPGWVGWWVICGDLPTDYVSADSIKHPRKAIEAIAERWKSYVEAVRGGAAPGNIEIAAILDNPSEMLPMLESRAAMLAAWAGDDEIWEDL